MCRRGCGGYASCRVRGGVVSLQRANMLGGRRSSLLLRKRACPRLRRLLRILLEVSAKGRWQRGLAKVRVVLVAGRDGAVSRELKQVGDEVAVAGARACQGLAAQAVETLESVTSVNLSLIHI